MLAGYATANLVGADCLEGAPIVNAVLMLKGENVWHLPLVAFGVSGILLTRPSVNKIKHYVEETVGRIR